MMMNSPIFNNYNNNYNNSTATANNHNNEIQIPQWMIEMHYMRKRLFLRVVEPIIVLLLGPITTTDNNDDYYEQNQQQYNSEFTTEIILDSEFDNNIDNSILLNQQQQQQQYQDHHGRRLSFLPAYVDDVNYLRASSMSFATLTMMYLIMSVILLVFLSCFYHNQKTSPLFVSPRRHRLPKLVPPPLPVDGAFSWVKVCLFMSDEEVSYVCMLLLYVFIVVDIV